MDLLSPVSKPALQALSAFADGEDAARLHHLLSPEGAANYKAWHQQSRCLLEVLEEFSSIKPPLGDPSYSHLRPSRADKSVSSA